MPKKPRVFRILSKLFFVGLIYLVMFLIIFFSKELSAGIKNGINISINLVIPSMFVFMIFSNIVINSRLREIICRPFLFLARYVFKIPKNRLAIVILSLVGGYPVGAKLISNAVSDGSLSKKQAENMLCYCVNCGPAFLISGVGITLFSSFKLGLYMYISQIAACIFTGFVMSFFNKDDGGILRSKAPDIPYSQLFVRAVNEAVRSMAVICGFIVAFSAIIPVISIFLSPLEDKYRYLIQGLLEATTGCSSLGEAQFGSSILMATLFTAFGGLCVHLQVYAMISQNKIKIGKFFLMRIFYTSISLLVMKCLLLLSPEIAHCISNNEGLKRDIYSVSPAATLFMIFLSVMLLFFSKKSDNI